MRRKERQPISLFKEAWEGFKNYFDEKCKRYSAGMGKEEAEEFHWICWSEFDLLTQLTRFYYKRLEESGLNNIEVHINERLKPENFDDYVFYEDLEKVKKELNKIPRIDLIIAFEDESDLFILCAEAKCLRYSVAWNRIEEDMKKLRTLKKYNVCSSLAYILLDDYYFINRKDTGRGIKKELNDYCRKYGITELYHTSKAKIPQ